MDARQEGFLKLTDSIRSQEENPCEVIQGTQKHLKEISATGVSWWFSLTGYYAIALQIMCSPLLKVHICLIQ
jgi:hypothetical protein